MKNNVSTAMCLLCLVAGISSAAQEPTDWPSYGHDPSSSRYSPLSQIDKANVGTLKAAWTYHLSENLDTAPAAAAPNAPKGPDGRPIVRPRRTETTPVMANGVLYLPSPYSRILALDPATGKKIWEHKLEGNSNASTRGVGYWAGDAATPARIIFGTSDGKLMALNAKDGTVATEFGDGGVVNLREGVENGFPNARVTMTSPPEIYKDLVITGSVVQESPSRGPAGDVRAWDAKTGKVVWTFHTVPRKGEPNYQSWTTPGATDQRSGTDNWGFASVDAETGLLYLPIGNPAANFYGADRLGNDLYANCVVALDVMTGKVKWYFQAIHHDLWDYDLAGAPLLVTVKHGAKKIPAVVFTSKAGLVFILNRLDGKPIYGVEERPVAQSTAPGEESAATQPFPVKPAPMGRMDFKMSDLATVTPEQKAFCENLIAKFGGMENRGPFTPPSEKMTVIFPGTLGVMNWHGGSYDPKLGYVFYNIENQADFGQLVKNPDGSPIAYNKTAPGEGTYARFWNPDNFWPCQAPPWGQLVAINVNTGDYAWKVPLGTIPELDAKGVHNTGSMNMGGSIATASGLVFISATPDHQFRAFDAATGKVLWSTELDAGAYATPMTYKARDGKQYVVIVATGGGYYDKKGGDSVIAFALP
jgi:quinoprotein glucose dehydrogenase